jgi:hypothetical protein
MTDGFLRTPQQEDRLLNLLYPDDKWLSDIKLERRTKFIDLREWPVLYYLSFLQL